MVVHRMLAENDRCSIYLTRKVSEMSTYVSMRCVCTDVNAVMTEAYMSKVWRRPSRFTCYASFVS